MSTFGHFCKVVRLRRKNFAQIRSHLCFAVTQGVVPPDTIKEDFETIGISEDAIKLSELFEEFNLTLKNIPSRSEKEYNKIMEFNNELIWSYAKKQYLSKCFSKIVGFTAKVDDLFDVNAYALKGTSIPYSSALIRCKKVFARKPYNIFWDSIGLKVQSFRDKTQIVNKDLDITVEEFEKIRPDLNYIGRGFAYSARTTQSKDYILGTPRKQKEIDNVAFQTWYESKTPVLVKILRLNLSNIPLSFALKEIQEFERDPKDPSNLLALKSKLISLQNEAIKLWRKSISEGKPDDFNFSKWLSGK